jgi:hypothetical protein
MSLSLFHRPRRRAPRPKLAALALAALTTLALTAAGAAPAQAGDLRQSEAGAGLVGGQTATLDARDCFGATVMDPYVSAVSVPTGPDVEVRFELRTGEPQQQQWLTGWYSVQVGATGSGFAYLWYAAHPEVGPFPLGAHAYTNAQFRSAASNTYIGTVTAGWWAPGSHTYMGASCSIS